MSRKVKLLLAIILSCFGLYFAFIGENYDTFIDNVSNVNLVDISIAILLLILSCFPRALRWKLLISPLESISFHHVFAATMIGYFGNGVMFFRLGEILKAFALSKGNNITISQAFGTVVAERILDLLMVIFIFALTFSYFPMEDEKFKIGIVFSISFVFLLVILILVAHKLNLLEKLSNFDIFSSKLGQKIISIMTKLFEGIVAVLKNNNISLIILSSVSIWVIYFYIGVIVLRACDIPLGYGEAGVLLVISSFILGIPSLPGAAGTLDAGVKYALVLIFNIPTAKALTYSIISHAVSYFPLLIVGFVYFLISSIKFKEIKDSKGGDEF